MNAGRRMAWRRWSSGAFLILGVIVLALVFAAYLRPGFVLDVANRLWLCF
jgi:hypothetical protein